MRNLRMVKVLLLLTCLFAQLLTAAHAKDIPLMGTVIEPNSSKVDGAPGVMPSQGVTITIQGTSMSAVSDMRGSFRFNKLKEGQITLVATKPGFATTVKTIALKGPTPGSVLIYMAPAGANGGADMMVADSVYVAFSSPQAGPSTVPNAPLSGPITTNLGALGAMAGGADPFQFGDGVPRIPGPPPVGPQSNPYAPASYGPSSYGANAAAPPGQGPYTAPPGQSNYPAPSVPAQPVPTIPGVPGSEATYLPSSPTQGGYPSRPPYAQPGQYTTAISAAQNALMVFDPDRPGHEAYTESPARLYWLAFNQSGTRLYGSNDQNCINVYDTVNNNILVQQIPCGGVVNDMVRVKNLVYAAIMRANGDGIMVIDPQRKGPVAIIPVPAGPPGGRSHVWSVTANSDGTRIFAAIGNERAGEVDVIDAATTHSVTVGRVGALPLGIAITPDDRYVLVANSKSATVSVLDAASLQQVGQIPVGITPFHIAVRPDGSKAYVTCKGSNAVSVISLRSMSQVGAIPVGSSPLGLAVAANGAHVYVANEGSATVSIINGNTDTYIKSTSPEPRMRPFGVAVKP